MTIIEAIKHCEEVAKQNETDAILYKNCKEIKANMYEKLTAEKAENDCRECAADHRQLAEWLMELKDLREENKVLIQKCDRLIKEKGELLSKVSDGDVLRICQLEEQLKNCKEEYANLNKISYGYYKELKEAKRLLKMAVEDISKMPCNNDTHSPDSCYICDKHGNCSYADSFKWCKADIALKLIGEDENET